MKRSENPCAQYENLVSAVLDDELDRTDHLEMLDHLVRCPGCRTFYLQARAVDGLAAAVRTPAAAPRPPTAMWQRIERRAGLVTTAWKIPAWAWRAAATVVLAAGLALAVWQWPAPETTSHDPQETVVVVLEEDRGQMTEARFVELATEILRADRRYHRAMFEVMDEVIGDTTGGDISSGEASESGDGRETDSESSIRQPA